MGKFNESDGTTFTRTNEEIIGDYARFLLEKGVIDDEEFEFYVTEGKYEVMDLLFDKMYETEVYQGVEVSTLSAFRHFCEFVIKDYNNQKVWNSFVREMFLSVERHKNSCIMASRSLGKSFFDYVLYPLFKMFLHEGTKFLHVSNIPKQIVENLRVTKDVINSNEMLYSKKEVSKGKDLKWTERQIEYNKGMLITLSAGTSPKGLHVNYVVVDDILTERSQLNDEEMETYIFGQLYPTVQRNKGRMIVTGTPLHRKDIYHLLMGDKPNFEGDPVDDGISHKGFYSRMFPIQDENGEPLIPDVYDKQQIETIRQIQGDITFEREYLLNCIDTSKSLFNSHLLDSISDGNNYDYYYSPLNDDEQFIIGCDVATAGSASADLSAFVVIQVINTDEGRDKVVRHVVHEKGMDVSDQVKTIQRLSETFNNALVIVEKNNVGVALIQELGKMNVNVEEFVTTKSKKEGIIRYLKNEMKNRNFWFPEETNEISKLKKELLNFGIKINKAGNERMEALTGHDDLVIAVAMANMASQSIGGLPFAVLQ